MPLTTCLTLSDKKGSDKLLRGDGNPKQQLEVPAQPLPGSPQDRWAHEPGWAQHTVPQAARAVDDLATPTVDGTGNKAASHHDVTKRTLPHILLTAPLWSE